MCGRTAQTQATVRTAASSMCAAAGGGGLCLVDKIGPRVAESASGGSSTTSGTKKVFSHVESSRSSETTRHDDEKVASPQVKKEHDDNSGDDFGSNEGDSMDGYPWRDNYNLSPGHDCVVFRLNETTAGDSTGTTTTLEMERKYWGLVVKGGTESSPVPSGASKHFANLMFNARSDTLFTKPTFARLLSQKRSCVVAVDGFFEWKAETAGINKGKKQPYFVYRKSDDTTSGEKKKPLLMAGLWTTVNTGWKPPQPPTLDTFTILTTEVCDSLKWLHSRMPVCIYDEAMALEWLQNPTPQVHQQLDRMAHNTPDGILAWHAVHPQMSKIQYRGADAIKAMPKPKSIASFFAPINKKTGSSPTKVSPSSNKRKGQPHEQQKDSKKKAGIASFFQKKDPK